MKQIIIFLTMTGFIILGCEKENSTNKITNLDHPLVCNPDEINRDSVVYLKFDLALAFPTRTKFNSSDSLFFDTIRLDINSDNVIDFLFYIKEVYSKGPYYYCKDSLFKYLHDQILHLRTDSEIYISSHWFDADLLFPGSIIDSLHSIQYNFFWNPATFENDLFHFSCGIIEPEVIEYYLPFMYRDSNKPRYGWIRFRLSMIENQNTVYYSSNYSYREPIIKIEILDLAYQRF